ncbi:extracellular solute-binding protein [uncultured Cohaesibacter sp.]|uniref:extracellular solute-binding protein n=1 Tax=uncultured Cohaesibacter sp. TaxID=1002546 RepID=UPI0029C94E31|nr:extracellular solute-binding protein [uncultured Cohaesibacter sp.]
MPEKDIADRAASFRFSRRGFLKSSALVASFGAVLLQRPLVGWASNGLHGLSVFGNLKYPPGFAHFDYVNPDAPKGGRFSFTAPSWDFNQNPQTFNTLNGYVMKGDAPPRIGLLFDTLMVRALDEPDAIYCHLAQTVSLSPDETSLRFRLRAEARFHDGAPVTPQDVAFSYNSIKHQGHPVLRTTLAEFQEAIVENDEIVLRLSGKQSRQGLLDMASYIPVFQKAHYEDKPFDASTLVPPIGSGPYKVGNVNPGSMIEFVRDPDYWGKDIPTAVGQNNFDSIRLLFARERTALFEAFKKGDLNFYEEFSSKSWATQYDFPAVKDGRVKRVELPDYRASGAQGWFFNIRHAKFSDPRTREAIGLAFDFEWTNQNLFYGLYRRTASFFERSELKAQGKPEGKELALLERFRDRLNPAVFEAPYSPPISDGSGKDRKLLQRANNLLQAAGWKREGQKLVDAQGKPLTIELMANSPVFEKVVGPWANNLALLGIELNFRLVDPSQFQSRIDNFDFDIVGRRFSVTPNINPTFYSFWGSKAADLPGSYNIVGLKDPVMDELIDIGLAAKNRDDMLLAGRAIDRIWRAGHYWIPNWQNPYHLLGLWDGFGYIEDQKLYDFLPETHWWQEDNSKAS